MMMSFLTSNALRTYWMNSLNKNVMHYIHS